MNIINLNSLNKKNIKLSLAESTKNILITGSTGSGKSTSILLPMLKNLIKNDCPGLVLDIKAELYSHIYTIAKDMGLLSKIYFVGTFEFCEKINILNSVTNIIQLENVINAMKPYKQENDGYWWYSGVKDLIDVIKVHEWYVTKIEDEKYIYDFKMFDNYINKKKYTKNLINHIENYKSDMPDEIERILNRIKLEPFSLYNDSKDVDVKNQKMWRSGKVSAVLSNFINEPFYEQFNDSLSTKTIHDLIYKENKIIILITPIEYEHVGHILGKLIREIFFKAVLSNNKKQLHNYKIGLEYNRFTFLMIDEYQFYINGDAKNGVITDNSWMGISRGYGNINIFATQSLSSLLAESQNSYIVDTIVQNCVNEIHLQLKDEKTYNHLKFISDTSDNINLLKTPKNRERVGFCRFSDNGITSNYMVNLSKSDESLYFQNKDYIEKNNLNSDELDDIKKISYKTNYNDFSYISKISNDFIITDNLQKIKFDDYYNIDEINELFIYFKSKPNILHKKNDYKKYLIGPKNIIFSDPQLIDKNKSIINFFEKKTNYDLNLIIQDPFKLNSFLKKQEKSLNVMIIHDKDVNLRDYKSKFTDSSLSKIQFINKLNFMNDNPPLQNQFIFIIMNSVINNENNENKKIIQQIKNSSKFSIILSVENFMNLDIVNLFSDKLFSTYDELFNYINIFFEN